MIFRAWIRNRFGGPIRKQTRSLDVLLTFDDFRHETERERMRADRNRSPLSILAIGLPPSHASQDDYETLAELLRQRLRVTDIMGCLTDGRVAILLPDTPKAGAWKVASDICDLYPVGQTRPDCEVYVYPDDSFAGAKERQPSFESDETGRMAELDSLFVIPTPKLKRAIDIAGAMVGLLVLAPLLATIAILIKFTSRGPVIFTQLREGHGGRRFHIYKFRTMYADAHKLQDDLRKFSVQDGPAFKLAFDPRTTRLGRFLRRTSLDELPQLWNVARGDMSLVGPRPLPVGESLLCEFWQRQRLAVTPGMTGLWQVLGRSEVSFDEWMRMDRRYVRDRSITYDMTLLLSTLPSLIACQGPR